MLTHDDVTLMHDISHSLSKDLERARQLVKKANDYQKLHGLGTSAFALNVLATNMERTMHQVIDAMDEVAENEP